MTATASFRTPSRAHGHRPLAKPSDQIVDLFAGGGGMSTAFEIAFGRSPDLAVNHSKKALSMHRRNHPNTRHLIADVFEVDPHAATQGKPVWWLHLSPDCTHHSQAAGGQPRDKKIRALSWVGYRWAAQVFPNVISLENVIQITRWGPLIAKRDKATGRVIKLGKTKSDTTIAAVGERVPVQQQHLIPDPKRAGETWRHFVKSLKGLGYEVETRALCAADHGGHTTRTRLFMIARRDGEPICWPDATHFKQPGEDQARWLPAADCIDFTLPSKSIFHWPKPLADKTLRRISKGIFKYVLGNASPFNVPIAHYNRFDPVHSIDEPMKTVTAYPKGGSMALATPIIVPATHQGDDRAYAVDAPCPTITGANRGELMVTTPILTKFRGESIGSPLDEPMPTITSGGAMARPAGAAHALGLVAPVLVGVGGPEYAGKPASAGAPLGVVTTENLRPVAAAYLAQMNGGFNETPGHDPRRPMSAVTSSGSQQQLVTAHLAHFRGNCDARDVRDPLHTISAGGEHHGVVSAFLSSYYTDESDRCRDLREPLATATTENRFGLVECTLSQAEEASALRVADLLLRYYSEGTAQGDGDLSSHAAPVTTKDRLALVTVYLNGVPYVIVDIRLRMLKPRELYRAQDFPDNYEIEYGHDGEKFSITDQVHMCGNSVDPVLGAALLRANAPAQDRAAMVA